jgi:16S rRNA (cytosine967-C5)-methyltransferase
MTRAAKSGRGGIAPARSAAYEVMRAVSSGAADLPHALARARTGLTDERDRALAGEIATGAIRWQGAFDHVVSVFTKRSIAKLDPEVLDILRCGMFQLLHLDRVPASAAVNDAVSLARRIGKSSAAPLVNAVLRRVSRERARLPLPPRPDSSQNPMFRAQALDYLATAMSHPRWLVERWLDVYGFAATEAWTQFNNAPARLTLRVNTLKTNATALTALLAQHDVAVTPGRYAPDALIVTRGNPLLTPLAHDGLFLIQEEASQLVAALVGARGGERVLDACASPGNKTIVMANAMGDRGLVVAADVRGRRIDLLTRTIARSGASSIRIVQADATALPFASDGAFDWILLDAPCSGLGTIRRDPDIRWRRTADDLPALRQAQAAMLVETSRALRPGGHLVYSTCSSEPDENEDVVAAAIAKGAVRPASVDLYPTHVRPLVNDAGHMRTYPFRDGLEAFFAAVLVKPA